MFVCEAKKYLLGFTLLGFLSRGTDTGHVGNDFLGVFSLSGTRLATVEDFGSLCIVEVVTNYDRDHEQSISHQNSKCFPRQSVHGHGRIIGEEKFVFVFNNPNAEDFLVFRQAKVITFFFF